MNRRVQLGQAYANIAIGRYPRQRFCKNVAAQQENDHSQRRQGDYGSKRNQTKLFFHSTFWRIFSRAEFNLR